MLEQLGKDKLEWMYTQTLRIREFEERVKRTFVEHPGAIRGHTHLADGAEATIVGALATRHAGDMVMSTYRCHGYPLVLGTSPRKMMAEIYGRKDGLCQVELLTRIRLGSYEARYRVEGGEGVFFSAFSSVRL